MNHIEESLKGRTVLVVDDNALNTFALGNYLEQMEMNVHLAENGVQAIDALKRNNNIDIVLMDVMMPEMDGFEAINKIKENGANPNMPIIAVTAKAMKGDREKCLEAGATDYVSKPLNLKELLEKMAKALNLE
jgi:two-component system, chemotaxis family, sensor kinase CheA